MSDEKDLEIEVIKADALTTLEISGSFYARISTLLINLSTRLDLKVYTKIISKFKEDFMFKPENEDEANIQTLLALVSSLEVNFLKDKKNYTIEKITDQDIIDNAKRMSESEDNVD